MINVVDMDQVLRVIREATDDRRVAVLAGTTRLVLADLFRELGYSVGAEIGTERGYFAEQLCRRIPGVELYCIDPYEKYSGYRDWQGDFRAEAQRRTMPYRVTFVRKYSLEAAQDFADNSLDFVYIDANHDLPWIADDIETWSRKVRPGGIISGHDYSPDHPDVVKAVDVLARHARRFIMGDLRNVVHPDLIASYFWIKE